MDDRRAGALGRYRSALREGIIANNLLPELHLDAGGFLTDVESDRILSQIDNLKQVDELIDALLTKGNEAFDSFCTALERNGYNSLAENLKKAGMFPNQSCGWTCVCHDWRVKLLVIM